MGIPVRDRPYTAVGDFLNSTQMYNKYDKITTWAKGTEDKVFSSIQILHTNSNSVQSPYLYYKQIQLSLYPGTF